MHFKVTTQYAGGRELPGEQFNDLNKAKAFIENKLKENAILKVKVIYRLYEWDDLIQEFDSSKTETSGGANQGSDGGAGGGKGAGSRPNPLSNAPRPPGTAQSWTKNDDEKGGKKK